MQTEKVFKVTSLINSTANSIYIRSTSELEALERAKTVDSSMTFENVIITNVDKMPGQIYVDKNIKVL